MLGRTNEFLGYSIDKVIGVRDRAMTYLRSLYDDLAEVRGEISGFMAAEDEIADRGLSGEEAVRVRAELTERERALRLKRDDLERKRVRAEELMASCSGAMGRLTLATEVINNRIDSFNSLSSIEDVSNVILGLQFAENENKRLARDIHDGPIQQFSAILLMFEYLERVVSSGDRSAIAVEIDRIKGELRGALAEFRTYLRYLQPTGLDTGLGLAIRRLAEMYEERFGVVFDLDIASDEDDFSTVQRANLFRVVQEAVSNAIRHGGASTIHLSYMASDRDIMISIRDDGAGFDVEQSRMMSEERGSFGLRNMRERVRLVGGTLRVSSGHGNGAEISISVPIGSDHE